VLTYPERQDDVADADAWQRLAQLLIRRRVELGFPRRTEFARHHGLSHDRNLSDIEKCRRTNYSDPMLAQFEQLYGWEAGSIEAVLAGGDPTPKPLPSETSVGADTHDDDSLMYRRPPGLSDREWEALKAETRTYIEWQLDRASRER
jgi:hypothetical protein